MRRLLPLAAVVALLSTLALGHRRIAPTVTHTPRVDIPRVGGIDVPLVPAMLVFPHFRAPSAATSPDPANDIAVAHRSARYWQDSGKTIPALVGDPVEVWEVPGGDLIRGGGTAATRAPGGGLQFPGGTNTYYDSSLSSGTTFTLYVDVDPEPGYAGPSNICASSSSAELSTFVQPYAGGAQSVIGVGGSFPSVADDPVERVRGMSVAGTATTIFAGGTESSTTTATGSIAGLRIGCSQTTWRFKGIVRSVVLRSVADAAPMRAAYRLWMAQQAPATTLRNVFALHVEGHETLDGADATAVGTFHSTHPDQPITLCANPETYEVLATATATARYTALLGGSDELAVHVHGWFDWVTAAGVTSRTLETYSSPSTPSATGYDVSLDSYTLAESTTIFDYAADLFVTEGFARPTTFLAGGYLLDADNRSALVAAGYTRDLSQVPPALTSAAYTTAGYGHLQGKLATEYSTITPNSQPTSSGGLIRIPSTGAVLAYNNSTVTMDRISRMIIAGIGTSFVNVEGEHFASADIAAMQTHVTWIKAYCAERAVTFQGVRANQIS